MNCFTQISRSQRLAKHPLALAVVAALAITATSVATADIAHLGIPSETGAHAGEASTVTIFEAVDEPSMSNGSIWAPAEHIWVKEAGVWKDHGPRFTGLDVGCGLLAAHNWPQVAYRQEFITLTLTFKPDVKPGSKCNIEIKGSFATASWGSSQVVSIPFHVWGEPVNGVTIEKDVSEGDFLEFNMLKDGHEPTSNPVLEPQLVKEGRFGQIDTTKADHWVYRPDPGKVGDEDILFVYSDQGSNKGKVGHLKIHVTAPKISIENSTVAARDEGDLAVVTLPDLTSSVTGHAKVIDAGFDDTHVDSKTSGAGALLTVGPDLAHIGYRSTSKDFYGEDKFYLRVTNGSASAGAWVTVLVEPQKATLKPSVTQALQDDGRAVSVAGGLATLRASGNSKSRVMLWNADSGEAVKSLSIPGRGVATVDAKGTNVTFQADPGIAKTGETDVDVPIVLVHPSDMGVASGVDPDIAALVAHPKYTSDAGKVTFHVVQTPAAVITDWEEAVDENAKASPIKVASHATGAKTLSAVGSTKGGNELKSVKGGTITDLDPATMTFNYTPKLDSLEDDTVFVTVKNAAGAETQASVTIHIRPKAIEANDLPAQTVQEGKDIDFDATPAIKNGPGDGLIMLWDGSKIIPQIDDANRTVISDGKRIHYFAKVGSAKLSVDDVRYVVVHPGDGSGKTHSPEASVKVTITPMDALQLDPISNQTDEDATTPVTLDVGAAVHSGGASIARLELSAADQTSVEGRTVKVIHSGDSWTLSYTPRKGFYSVDAAHPDTIHFDVFNAAGGKSAWTATVRVKPVAPKARPYNTLRVVVEGKTARIAGLRTAILQAGQKASALKLWNGSAPVDTLPTPMGTFTVDGDDLVFAATIGKAAPEGAPAKAPVVLVHPGDATLWSNAIEAQFDVFPMEPIALGDGVIEVEENSAGQTINMAPVMVGDAVGFKIGSAKNVDDHQSEQHGTISHIDASAHAFVYVPPADTTGDDVVHVGVANRAGVETWSQMRVHLVPTKAVAKSFTSLVNAKETLPQTISHVNVLGRQSGNAGVIVKLMGSSGPTDGPIDTAHGSVRVLNGTDLEYTPKAGAAGQDDALPFVLVHPKDKNLISNTATVTIRVGELDGLTALKPGEMTVPENSRVAQELDTATLLAPGETGAHLIVGPAQGVMGSKTAHDGMLTTTDSSTTVAYQPSTDFYGDDIIHFSLHNAANRPTSGTITVHVVPQAPVAQNVDESADTGEEASSFIVRDVRKHALKAGNRKSRLMLWDGSQPVTAWHSDKGSFSVSADGDHIQYTANPGLATDQTVDTVAVVLVHPSNPADPSLRSAVATVKVVLTRQKDPQLAEQELVVTENAATGATLDLHRMLNDAAHIAMSRVEGGSLGQVHYDPATMLLTYTPHTHTMGSDQLTVVATTRAGHTVRATVHVRIVAGDVITSTWEEAAEFNGPAKTIDVAPHLSGSQAQGLTAVSAQKATITVQDMVLSYQPSPGFSGDDVVQYTVRNAVGRAFTGSLTVHVATAESLRPHLIEQRVTTLAGVPVTVDVVAGAKGGPFQDLQIVERPAASMGRVTVQGTNLVFEPKEDTQGEVVIGYTVGNRFGRSATYHVTVHVNPLAIAVPLTASTITGKAVDVDLTTGAQGGPFIDAQILELVPAASGIAKVTRTADGHWHASFRSNDRFDGTTTISYVLKNAYSTSRPATVTVTVTARPDPTKDADVVGLAQAQVDQAKRFATVQIGNFASRLSTLHGAREGAGFTNGITVTGLGATGGACQESADRPWVRCPLKEDATVTQASASSNPALSTARRQAAPEASALRVWTAGAIDMGKDAVQNGAVRSGVRFDSSGLSVGVDAPVSRTLILGAGVGYGRERDKIGKTGTQVKGNAWSAVLYADYQPANGYYIDALLGVQHLAFQTRRTLADSQGHVTGSRSGTQVFGSLTAGLVQQTGAWRLSPYLRLDGSAAHLKAYEEQGNDTAALHYFGQTAKALIGNAGFQADYLFKSTHGTLAPMIKLELQRDLSGSTEAAMRYADLSDGIRYVTRTRPVGSQRFDAELGATWTAPHGTVIKATVHETGSKGNGHERGVNASVEKSF